MEEMLTVFKEIKLNPTKVVLQLNNYKNKISLNNQKKKIFLMVRPVGSMQVKVQMLDQNKIKCKTIKMVKDKLLEI